MLATLSILLFNPVITIFFSNSQYFSLNRFFSFFIDEFTHEPDQYNYYCDSNKTFILCTCKKNDLNSPYPNHIYLETIASGVHAKCAMSKALAFLDTLTSYGITLSSINKSLVTYYEQYGFRFIKTLTEDWSTIGLEPSKTVYFMARDKSFKNREIFLLFDYSFVYNSYNATKEQSHE